MLDANARRQLETMRHSTSHLMAAAIQHLFPQAKFGVGPAIENGFYYDIELPQPLLEGDLTRIEETMRVLKSKDLQYDRIEIPIDDAIAEMTRRGQTYKVELLRLLKEKGSTAATKDTGDSQLVDLKNNQAGVSTVSLYKTGEFLDLCRGPHVASTKQVGEFKLIQVAGAYWRGSERNPQLQRIYGIAFNTSEELDLHLRQLEEARKRDHRKLGQALEIFTFCDEIGKGLPLWLPNGTVLRDELEKLAREEEHKEGYVRVSTPHIAKDKLYLRSGHIPYYKEDMYAPIEIEVIVYYLKPMNCPFHHQIFLSKPRTYRELPLRVTEYGHVYRFEMSGVLSGLMRTRGFIQNDAHIYCTYDQAEQEFLNVMRLHAKYYDMFGIKDYYMRFSKPDLNKLDKYVNDPEKWIAAMNIIRKVMDESGYPYIEEEGEAAFYGPKIDFIIRSAVGNEYAISTNQLDFLASSRFELTYTGSDGKLHPVYVVHRAPLGSHERFVAFLIEHFAGAFPTWLSPTQIMVIPISERHNEYGSSIHKKLIRASVPTVYGGVRAELDDSRDTMQKRIRSAQQRKIPYMVIVGDNEVQGQTISLRLRSGKELRDLTLDQLITRINSEVTTRQDIPL